MNFILEEKKKEDEEIVNFNNELNNQNNSDNEHEDNKLYNRDKDNSSNMCRSRSKSSKSSGYRSSSDKNNPTFKIVNKETVAKFGKYINSSDGNEITLLIGAFLDKKSKFKFFSISKLLIRQLAYCLEEVYQKILNINDITNSNSIELKINNIKNKYKGGILNLLNMKQ